MIDTVKFGRMIRTLREKAGYTQKELADQLFVSGMAVSKWESGKSIPDLSTLRRLAKFLSMDIDGLVDGTATYMDDSWKGVLRLPDKVEGISCSTWIYDKPMIDYLIGYFLLAGVRDIWIQCSKKEQQFIMRRFGSGECCGFHLEFSTELGNVHKEANHVFFICAPVLVYGVDLTRFLMRGMSHRNAIVNLTSVTGTYRRSSWAASQMIVKDSFSIYDYDSTPFYFYTVTDDCKLLSPENYINQQKRGDQIIEEPMDKGFVFLPLKSELAVDCASSLVKMIQELNGYLLYCPLEIAWRRGMIDRKQLKAASDIFPEYAEYLNTIC